MRDEIRLQLALDVCRKDLDQNQKIEFLQKLISLTEDQFKEITLHILNRGLKTMPDLSWLRDFDKELVGINQDPQDLVES